MLNRVSATRPDGVLFDCDGVLVDSEPLTGAVLQDNLARHGLDLAEDELTDLFLGRAMPDVMRTARAHGAALPEDWLDGLYSEIYARLGKAVEPIPGISAVLDALDAGGIGYAVGSNGPHQKMRVSLGRTGLLPRLQGRIVSREDVAKPKPAPDIYLRGAAMLGVAAERCIVVEDSPSGAQAASAAGMTCLGFVAATDADRMRPICDGLFTRMEELPGLLGL